MINLTIASKAHTVHPLESLSLYTTLLASIAESIKVQHDILSVFQDFPILLQDFPIKEILRVQQQVNALNCVYTQKNIFIERQELIQLLNIAAELKRFNKQIVAALSESYSASQDIAKLEAQYSMH